MISQEYNELRNPRYYKFLDYKEYFSEWDWEWFTTLTYPDSYGYKKSHVLRKPLIEWTRELCKQERIRVGYFNIMAWRYGHPHMHLLMLGYGQGGSKSLVDVDCGCWENQWPYKAEIQIPRCKADVEEYIASYAFWKHAHKERLESYGIDFLTSFRRTNQTNCQIIG